MDTNPASGAEKNLVKKYPLLAFFISAYLFFFLALLIIGGYSVHHADGSSLFHRRPDTPSLLFQLRCYVYHARFSPDSQLIVTISMDGTARVWRWKTAQTICLIRGEVKSAIFSPDSIFLITVSGNPGSGEPVVARVWEVYTRQLVTELLGHKDRITSAQFNSDSRSLVTSSYDMTARVWGMGTAKSIAEFEQNVESAALGIDGKVVLTTEDSNKVLICDLETGKIQLELGESKYPFEKATFSPDSKFVAAVSGEQEVWIWKASSGKLVAKLKRPHIAVYGLAFSPDARSILTHDGWTVRVWAVASGNVLYKLRDWNYVNSALFSPDGKYIGTACENGTSSVWGVRSRERLAVLEGHDHWVSSAVFSPDGKQIVTASLDETTRVWEAATGKMVAELRGHRGEVY